MSITQLSKQYRISKSLQYKIKTMTISDLTRRQLQRSSKVFWTEKQMIIQCIQKFIRNRTNPFIVKDVRNYVYQNIWRYYQYDVLYKIMKKDLYFSYKRFKPRPNSINLEEVQGSERKYRQIFSKISTKYFWIYTIKKIIIFILYLRFGSKIWPILLIIDLSIHIYTKHYVFFYNE